MIKTGHKSKPAGGLTHSLGAKQISEALSGIRIYDFLSIAFEKEKGKRIGLFVPGWNSRYMKGESTDLLDYLNVIEGAYSEPLNKWTIKLKPVHTDSNNK